MEYCVYLTIYKGMKLPAFYVGHSTVKRVEKGYRGSVVSEQHKATWREEQRLNPHLFKTMILSRHSTRLEASERETALQMQVKAHKNPLFINRCINGEKFFREGGWKHSEEAKQKIAQSVTGHKHTAESRAKMSVAKAGSTQTAESNAKRAMARQGYKHSPETLAKITQARKGRSTGPQSQETKMKRLASRQASAALRGAW